MQQSYDEVYYFTPSGFGVFFFLALLHVQNTRLYTILKSFLNFFIGEIKIPVSPFCNLILTKFHTNITAYEKVASIASVSNKLLGDSWRERKTTKFLQQLVRKCLLRRPMRKQFIHEGSRS